MTIREMPYYTLSAAALADWIESQPDKWWSVDGDPWLMSVVDFPCPSDELAPKIRKVGKRIWLRDTNPSSQAHGQEIAVEKLDELADTNNRSHRKTYLMSWEGSDEPWLLLEDDPMLP